MAEDRELFDDVPEDPDMEAEDMDEEEEEMPEDEPVDPAGEQEMLKRATASCAEMGIIIPDHIASAKDFLQHFNTAVETHKATKALSDQGKEATAESEAPPPQEEEKPMMMSTIKHHDPLVQAMAYSCAENTRKKRLAKINKLARSGLIKPATIAKLRNQAAQIRLSYAGRNVIRRDALDDTLDSLLEAVEQVDTAGGRLSLVGVQAQPSPLDPKHEAEIEDSVNRLVS